MNHNLRFILTISPLLIPLSLMYVIIKFPAIPERIPQAGIGQVIEGIHRYHQGIESFCNKIDIDADNELDVRIIARDGTRFETHSYDLIRDFEHNNTQMRSWYVYDAKGNLIKKENVPAFYMP